MRIYLPALAGVFLALSLSTGATSQSGAQSSTAGLPDAPQVLDWQSVQSLQIGATVYVKSNVTRSRCKVQAVNADSFSCDGGPVFKRSEIESIKRPNRLASTLAGAGIGVAVGIGIGEATFKSGTTGYNRAGAALAGGVLFGTPGALVGYFTDFTQHTLYRRR